MLHCKKTKQEKSAKFAAETALKIAVKLDVNYFITFNFTAIVMAKTIGNIAAQFFSVILTFFFNVAFNKGWFFKNNKL